MTIDEQKKAAAEAALEYVSKLPAGAVIGVGTGSTANYFIDGLRDLSRHIDGAVASSEASTERLQAAGVEVMDLNMTGNLPLYVDGADESNPALQLIKGGGGALTREKIVAAASETFICIVDESKLVDQLGAFALPVEVLPMARSYVARQIVALGGDPERRESFISDNGNYILDISDMDLRDPGQVEETLNQLAGVLTVGLFARRPADLLLIGNANGTLTKLTA